MGPIGRIVVAWLGLSLSCASAREAYVGADAAGDAVGEREADSSDAIAAPGDAGPDRTLFPDAGARRPRCTIVINTHEWYYHDRGAVVLSRIMDLLGAYQLRGEFYLTETVWKMHEKHHPDVLARMKADGHAVSFHVRAPHPVTFRSSLSKQLSAADAGDLRQSLYEVETHELDLTTGELRDNVPGGYQYMKDKLGYPPRVAGLNAQTDALRNAELAVLQSMGLRMYVRKHTGDRLEVTAWGPLARPSEFAIEKIDGLDWSALNQPLDPNVLLRGATGDGVIIVHDSDFIADKAGWNQIYWDDQNRVKPPPWSLTSTNPGFSFRTEAHLAQIWANYESFLSYAAANFDVVTSEDLIVAWDDQGK